MLNSQSIVAKRLSTAHNYDVCSRLTVDQLLYTTGERRMSSSYARIPTLVYPGSTDCEYD